MIFTCLSRHFNKYEREWLCFNVCKKAYEFFPRFIMRVYGSKKTKPFVSHDFTHHRNSTWRMDRKTIMHQSRCHIILIIIFVESRHARDHSRDRFESVKTGNLGAIVWPRETSSITINPWTILHDHIPMIISGTRRNFQSKLIIFCPSRRLFCQRDSDPSNLHKKKKNNTGGTRFQSLYTYCRTKQGRVKKKKQQGKQNTEKSTKKEKWKKGIEHGFVHDGHSSFSACVSR